MAAGLLEGVVRVGRTVAGVAAEVALGLESPGPHVGVSFG